MATLKTGLNADGTLIADSLFDPVTGTGAGQIEFDSSSLPTANIKKHQIEDYIRLRLAPRHGCKRKDRTTQRSSARSRKLSS